ncbi:putative CdaR family transcriptional regulator, partial [Kineosphaera limosa NBRC 100340]
MATTLQDLVAGLPDDLLPTGPLPTAVTRVTGVHVSELLDPTPFLVGGELLLTTGLSLTTHLTRLVDYVTRLRGAGVVALGFGVGPVHAALPPPLQAACERAGLPLLVVPTRSRFQTVVAAFWQREREAERQDLHGALGSTHALVRAATQGPGDRGRTRARVVRALATGVGGWAAHLDADGRAGTAWPMTARPMARRAGEYVQRLRSAAVAGATFPLDHDDVLLQPIAGAEGGYLACGCTRPIPQRMRHLTLAACAVLDLHASRLAPHVALQEALPSVLGQLVVLGHAGAARDVAAAQGRPWPAAVRVSVAEHPRTANGRELPGSPLVAWAAGSAGLAWHAETTSGLWGAGRAQGAAPARERSGELRAHPDRAQRSPGHRTPRPHQPAGPASPT